MSTIKGIGFLLLTILTGIVLAAVHAVYFISYLPDWLNWILLISYFFLLPAIVRYSKGGTIQFQTDIGNATTWITNAVKTIVSFSIGIVVLVILLWAIKGVYTWIFNSDSSYSNSSYSSSYSSSYDYDEENVIDVDTAIDDYWDEITDYLDGTEEIEACYDGYNCYDLEADISNGQVETLYFPNGGYVTFWGDDFNSSGYAYDTDDDNRDWEFTLDMNSSFVKNAVEEWADDNGYTLE